MRISNTMLAYGLAVFILAAPQIAQAQDIDFGDDNGMWANDDECDDMRFSGPGMTATILLDEDVKHDATDCRTAYEDGKLTYNGDSPASVPGTINWGTNDGGWANDNECDDARFVGSGMANALLVDNIGKDAIDCKAAFDAGNLQPNPLFAVPSMTSPIEFGTDSDDFGSDGKCDDIRFTGAYASSMIFLVEHIGGDATDCRNALLAGVARWQGNDLGSQ